MLEKARGVSIPTTQPTIRWTNRVGRGGGHHPYHGKLFAHPLGVVAVGGSRAMKAVSLDPETGHTRFEVEAKDVVWDHAFEVLESFIVTWRLREDSEPVVILAHDLRTGATHEHALATGERPVAAGYGAILLRVVSGNDSYVRERRFDDPAHPPAETLRVFRATSAEHVALTSAIVVARTNDPRDPYRVFDRLTAEEIGSGEGLVMADEAEWLVAGPGSLALCSRQGTRWSIDSRLLPWAMGPHLVVAGLRDGETAHGGVDASLVLLDRATGAIVHTGPVHRNTPSYGWGLAVAGSNGAVVNDREGRPDDRSVLRAFANDGSELWQLSLGENAWVCALAMRAGRLYAVTASGAAYCLESD